MRSVRLYRIHVNFLFRSLCFCKMLIFGESGYRYTSGNLCATFAIFQVKLFLNKKLLKRKCDNDLMLRRSVRSVFKFPLKEPVHFFLGRKHFIGCHKPTGLAVLVISLNKPLRTKQSLHGY